MNSGSGDSSDDLDDDRIEAIADEFFALRESSPELSQTTFAERFPARWRTAIIDEIDQMLAIRRLLDPSEPPRPPETIGHYRIVGTLGRGGIATVFRAVDTTSDKVIALKVLHEHLMVSRPIVRRFDREANIGFRLKHPNIVGVLDAGTADNRRYIVREMIVGRNLAEEMASRIGQWSERATRSDADRILLMRIEWALGVGRDIGRALIHAHSQKVVHRDVKPQNVLIDAEGTALLSDFGLASARTIDDLTVTGEFFGSPHYSSPEQARTDNGTVGPQSDLFSLGIVLYEVATGRRPFGGGSCPEILHSILYETPRPPSKLNPRIPRALDELILVLLEKEPRRRHRSAMELVVDLERIAAGKRGLVRRPAPIVRLLGALSERPKSTALAMFVVFILIGTWAFASRSIDRAYWPSVTIDVVGSPGARVVARRLQSIGAVVLDSRVIGDSPIRRERLAPGLYHFIAEDSSGGYSELIRFLALDESVELTMRIPSGDAASGMVKIKGARIAVNPAVVTSDNAAPPLRMTVELDDFLIDEREVSIGDYIRFLHESGKPWPSMWPTAWQDPKLPPQIWMLPAVEITIDEMNAYAAWYGKRLPTFAEWQLAARGPSQYAYPWGDEPGDIGSMANIGREATPEQRLDPTKAIAALLVPVDQRKTPYLQPLLNIVGNAWEATASPQLIRKGGGIEQIPGFVFIAGYGFGTDAASIKLRGGLAASAFLQRDIPDVATGFRCARSIRK